MHPRGKTIKKKKQESSKQFKIGLTSSLLSIVEMHTVTWEIGSLSSYAGRSLNHCFIFFMLWLKILSDAHVSQSNKPILQYTFKYIYMFGFYVCYFSRDPCLIRLFMDLKTPCQQDPWNRAFYHMVPDSLRYMRPEEQFQPAMVGALFNLTGKVHGVLYSLLPWLQWLFDATFWNHIATTWRTFHEQVLPNVCHAIPPW